MNEEKLNIVHKSVMPQEILGYLQEVVTVGNKIIVDCTLGEGGHSELFLKNFPEVTVIGFERDPEILAKAVLRLQKYEDRFIAINDNFRNLDFNLFEYQGKISGFLFDFGISSFHFDAASRGFSYAREEKLDMRLDEKTELTAEKIVNTYPEKEIADLIYQYGEERWSRRIASAIVRAREEEAITTTTKLADIVYHAIPAKYRHSKGKQKIHPATRTFQALRIVVNDELTAIETALKAALPLLAPGGRLLGMSFHSLEDRIVKRKFKEFERGCTCGQEPQNCYCLPNPQVKILTKKPIMAGEEELTENKRARSAKLRVCEKLAVK